MPTETWEVWYPKAAATGILFARGRLDATGRLLVHAVPDVITAEVRDADGERLAFNAALERTLESPICLLRREGNSLSFEVLKRYDLELDRQELSYADLGKELGISPDRVRHALVHARAALREIVTEIVGGYVDGPEHLGAELRQLLGD